MSPTLPIALFLSAVSPGSAVPPAPDANEQIIVRGQRDSSQIASYVDRLSVPATDEQLGKFLQPVCPGVVGLPGADNRLVADRMWVVVRAVGAPVARLGCTPNAILIVVHDKATAIDDLQRKRPEIFGNVPRAEIDRLKQVPGSAVGWQIVGKLGSDGMPVSSARTGPMSGADDEVMVVNGFGGFGRLRKAVVPQFLVSVLLVEARALDGVTTIQLADFASMRLLAPISWRTATVPSHSILGLLKGQGSGEAPPSVTWWDVAFLKSLYGTSNAVPADVQRSAIAGAMKREMGRVPAEDR